MGTLAARVTTRSSASTGSTISNGAHFGLATCRALTIGKACSNPSSRGTVVKAHQSCFEPMRDSTDVTRQTLQRTRGKPRENCALMELKLAFPVLDGLESGILWRNEAREERAGPARVENTNSPSNRCFIWRAPVEPISTRLENSSG